MAPSILLHNAFNFIDRCGAFDVYIPDHLSNYAKLSLPATSAASDLANYCNDLYTTNFLRATTTCNVF